MNDKQKLMEDNVNLVYYIISREYPTFLYDDDVVQSGMLGLCLAANAWEGKGMFTTYAGKCIRREIHKEFINRKSYSQTASLESKVGEEGTLEDLLAGEDDVAIMDDAFFNELTKEEREVLELSSSGYDTEEISKMRGYTAQKVTKLLRLVNIKWRYFNEN